MNNFYLKMSLRKVNLFLKENNIQIIDLWVEQSQRIRYLRVFHNLSGILLFINIYFYDIKIESSDLYFQNIYYIHRVGDFKEDYSEEMILFFNNIKNHLPQYNNSLLFHYSNYFIESHDKIYKIINDNNPLSSFHTIYFFQDLEWLYDNYKNIENTIFPFHNDIYSTIQISYHDFIEYIQSLSINYTSIINNINSLYNKIISFYKSFLKIRNLWVKVHIYYSQQVIKIKKLEDYSDVYSVNETNRKIKEKNEMKLKMKKVLELKKKVKDNIIIIREQYFHYNVIFLYYTKELKKNLIGLDSIMIKLNKEV